MRHRLALPLVLLVLAALFAALGVWQVQRRVWKHELIARTEARLHATPQPAPGPAAWPGFNASGEEYRPVTVTGRFTPGRYKLAQAVTVLGPGFWLIAPFQSQDGFTVLINRGFVPSVAVAAGLKTPEGDQQVRGLLRVSEPGGGFLRRNDPQAGRWYSRDVEAMAKAMDLGPVAPYFIDADAGPAPESFPRGGLTVLIWRDNHLVYALTWFALMLMALGGAVYIRRFSASTGAQDDDGL